MHALGDDVTLPSFLLHHAPQPLSTKIRSFLFLDTKQSTLLFFVLHLNRSRENQHSSLKLFSSNIKYFCFVFVQQLFLFIY